MNSSDAFRKTVTLTFTRACSCGNPGCIDCRAWLTEADVPLHPHGVVLPAIAGTVGVDSVRLVNHKYSIVTVIAKAFDADFVIESIKENVAALGPVNYYTGLPDPGSQRAAGPIPVRAAEPEQEGEAVPADALFDQLDQVVEALNGTAEALRQPRVLELSGNSIVYKTSRYTQVYPAPPGRSRLRSLLLRLLAD